MAGRVENLKPWKPGQSGNPSGKPKDAAIKARELVGNDPNRLLGILLEIAENPAEAAADRKSCAIAFLERGWGKATTFEPVKDGDPLALDDVDRAVKSTLDELAHKRQARTVPASPPSVVAGNGTGGATTPRG